MTKAAAIGRIAKLKELINDYRYHYHVLDQSIMSEAAADSLKHELSTLEDEYPDLITPDSPTQRVAGAPLPGFISVAHSQRMLSLNDVFTEEELLSWQERIEKLLPPGAKLEYFTDIKMDGLACALIYRNGMLERAITRGDGFNGEDVTLNVRTIDSVPLTLRHSPEHKQFLSGRTEVRGEIVMYKDDFKKLNDERATKDLPLFANPRNTAAGTIRQLDPKLVASRPLHFRAYDLLRDDPAEVPTNALAYKTLSSLGFLTNTDAKIFKDLVSLKEYADKWEVARTKLKYNTDGLVIKVNDRALYDRLGVVGKAPRAAVAYKYAAEQATTKVKDIFVSIGRTGVATPVAMLEPVVVAGSTVQMATLHNETEVLRKDIRIGDTVIVHKAGDIIPEVVQPLIKLRNGSEKVFKMPEKCPECGTVLIKLKPEDAAWRCPNEHCPSRSWKRIEHYASKAALDIEGLGEKNVIALINAQLVKDQSDIYKLKSEQLEKLDRFGQISANKLAVAIKQKKNPSLSRFIYGLGIRHIGVQTAIDLANHFKDLDKLKQSSIDELSQIEGIGEIVAESVVEWFNEKRNLELLEKFKGFGVWPKKVVSTGGKLSGKKFVVTGSLETLGREQAVEKIRALGGEFQSSVAHDTDFLVVGANVGAGKLKKAEQLGTKQINEDTFLKML